MRLAVLAALLASLACERRPQEPAVPAAPPPVTATRLATDLDDPRALALDAHHVWFADGAKLRRVAKAGASVEEVVAAPDAITTVAVDGDTVFVGARGGVYRFTAGHPLVRLAPADEPRFLVVDRDRIWWWDGDVRQVSRQGGAPIPQPTAPVPSRSPVRLDRLHVSNIQVEGMPVVTTGGATAAMAVDATHVYWAGAGALWRRPKDGAAKPERIARIGERALALALDDRHVYWGDEELEAVLRRPKAGGPIELVTASYGLGSTLAVDEEAVFVVQIEGDVERVAKSDRATVRLCTACAHTLNNDGLAVVLDADDLFVGIHAWRWKTSSAVVDVTPGAKLPDVEWLGEVVRLSKRPPAGRTTPPPAALRRASVWFEQGTATPQDRGNATRWVGEQPAFLRDATRRGELPVIVRGLALEPGGLDLARRRAAVAASLARDEIGGKGARLVEAAEVGDPEDGERVDIVLPLPELSAVLQGER